MSRRDAAQVEALTRELEEARRRAGALASERDGIEAERARLAAENERLRGLLGLDAERVVGEEPPLFASEPVGDVHGSSPPNRKIALFRSLFRGREDVYALRWDNARTGKSGYAPAVVGGWGTAKRSRRREYLPLTDEVVEAHLRGEETVGLFPLLDGDVCWLLACDFDGPTWALDALAYYRACADNGLPAAMERSRSGEGAHVWLFFSAPIPAVSARRLGAALLRVAMTARGELDLASYDRLFPSQDLLPKSGFGNLIALPLQGEVRARGNAAFLNPASLEPWPDQWRSLSETRRVFPEVVERLAKELAPPAAWQELRSGRPPPRGDQPPPEVVVAELHTGLSVDKAGMPAWLLASIKHLASLHNPDFHRRQRLRLSTHDTPRLVRCYDEDLTHLHLPRGLQEDLDRMLSAAGSRLRLIDRRAADHPRLDLALQGQLSARQQDAVAELLRYGLGVLVAPPGTGKTVMACAVIAARRLPTLVLVHRKPLLEQWRRELQALMGLAPQQIGEVGGGRNRRTGTVDLATLQSLTRREDLGTLLAAYGLIVVDECHHIPAVSFEAVIKQAAVRNLLGLTATPYRRDGMEGIIAMQCGPVRHEISAQQTLDDAKLTVDLRLHETAFSADAGRETAIHDIFQALVDDEPRTAQICRDVVAAYGTGRRCLVLTQRRDHGDLLVHQLQASGCQPFVLHGGLGKKARATVVEGLRSLAPDEPCVVVATGQYIGEGFDCPPLDTLFLAFPISYRGSVVQYTGRLLRPFEGKEVVRIHDYVDGNVAVLQSMHAKRLAAYRKLGYLKDPRRGRGGGGPLDLLRG